MQGRIIQASDIHLYIFNHNGGNWQRDLLDHPDYLLHIRLDGWRQPPTAFAGGSVIETIGTVPFTCATTFPMTTASIHFLFHISTMVDLCRQLHRSIADAG